MSARIFNVLIGTWLFLSTFAWGHSPAQGVATMVCGLLTMLTGVLAIYYPRVRYLTALIAVALFVSSLATSHATMNLTFWHNAVIAIVIFLIALFDTGSLRARRRGGGSDVFANPIEASPSHTLASRGRG